MSATNGSGHSFRSRRRLLVFCMAAALLVPAVFASTASAKKKPPKPKHFYYLALGDSISYGYSLVKFDENFNLCKSEGPEGLKCEPPPAFEPNLVTYVAKAGKLPKASKTSSLNLSCPGETSSGLIGHNEALGGGKGAEYNPCGWHNASKLRRHTEYGSASQLEYAVAFSKENPAAVTLVSLQIGSNDELHVLGLCRSKEYREAHKPPYSTEAECVEKEAPALFGKIINNMGKTIGALRAEGGGNYSGPIVVLGFYNPYGILQHATDALQAELNKTVEGVIEKGEFGPRVRYTNPFGIFNAGGVGGAAEKKALEANTEFYNANAILDERVKTVEEQEIGGKPNLAQVTAFQECCGSPNLKEVTENVEKNGSPPLTKTLAATIKEAEESGNPNLAEVEAFQEASGKPNLAEAEAFQEASGKPNLAEAEAFQEESGKPNLKEATEAHEAEAHAGYIAACEGKGKTLAECEIGWATSGKAEYEAAVEQAFDEKVEEGFDEAVEAGYDKAVKEGYDAKVKEVFDAAVKGAFDTAVKSAFQEAVEKAFNEAGSPGDIHPSANGYVELGKLVSAAAKGL
jgi:hypothetical protein